MKYKIILTFVSTYLPGFKSGGPVRSLSNIVDALGKEYKFYIVTSDRDSGDVTPYDGIITDRWIVNGDAMVYYSSPSKWNLKSCKKLLIETPHDIIYFNSLFSPLFTLLPLLVNKWVIKSKKPVIIAPRGELSPGALQFNFLKKKLFIIAAKILELYKNINWQASSREETIFIKQHFGISALICIAQNIPEPVAPLIYYNEKSLEDRHLRVVFLSRIVPKKNLSYVLAILSKINCPIQFDIWGTKEDEKYWKLCEQLINKLPNNVIVKYQGLADHSKVNKILSKYDLFFFPTLGENYGHVIAESLSAGTPVLISDQTPWRNLKDFGVGWDISLNKEKEFVNAIYEANEKVKNNSSNWREKVHGYAIFYLTDESIVQANRILFQQSLYLNIE